MRGKVFHFGRFKIVSAKNQALNSQLNTRLSEDTLPPKDATPLSVESVNVKARRRDAKSPSAGPGSSDQENCRTQAELRNVRSRWGIKTNARGEHFGGTREKFAAGKQEQNMTRGRRSRGSLRLAFERVGGRKLQDVVGIGGIRWLSKERQRARGEPVMMRRATAAVMQNHTAAALARAEQKLVIGIERPDQPRQCRPQR